MSNRQPTSWPHVAAGLFAGVCIALLVGKMSATVPLLRENFGTGLTAMGFYISLLSLAFALGGLGFGLLVRRIGARRAAVAGLALGAIGSGLGALAPSFPLLFLTRAAEALGYSLTVTAIPSLIQSKTAPPDRSFAMALWGTWLPIGVSVMLAIAALAIGFLGWRGIFALVAAANLAACVLIARLYHRDPPLVTGRVNLRGTLRRDPVRHVVAFVCFSAPSLVVMSFLPTLLHDDYGVSVRSANAVVTGAVLAMVPATLSAGWLLGRGVRPDLMAALGFVAGGTLAIPLFGGFLPLWAVVICAGAYNLVGGLVAAVLWSAVPRMMRNMDEAPVLNGLLFQGAGIGQLIGPPLAGVCVGLIGSWSGVWLFTIPFAMTGCWLALNFGRR
ncbi:MFS transporter [Paroceanicella profunda]|uniref:MFS transporter n=1 Tax=Paroceanicella profunda TaxID=2579971 RepID=A0A5B8FVQ8_9RHOB|nr:MFS transporter [Paroceanicella profunda]QDL91240.1 MFS transporter [Paroceanicella profunda]